MIKKAAVSPFKVCVLRVQFVCHLPHSLAVWRLNPQPSISEISEAAPL